MKSELRTWISWGLVLHLCVHFRAWFVLSYLAATSHESVQPHRRVSLIRTAICVDLLHIWSYPPEHENSHLALECTALDFTIMLGKWCWLLKEHTVISDTGIACKEWCRNYRFRSAEQVRPMQSPGGWLRSSEYDAYLYSQVQQMYHVLAYRQIYGDYTWL